MCITVIHKAMKITQIPLSMMKAIIKNAIKQEARPGTQCDYMTFGCSGKSNIKLKVRL